MAPRSGGVGPGRRHASPSPKARGCGTMSAPSISPFDAPNRRTIAQSHPSHWRPPRPKDVYELVVIGGGPCCLTAAITAAKAGHTVALAERNLTGGTCVNFGCTSSKALLRAARAVHQ